MINPDLEDKLAEAKARLTNAEANRIELENQLLKFKLDIIFKYVESPKNEDPKNLDKIYCLERLYKSKTLG